MAATSRGAPDARARLATTRAPNIGPHASAREPISRRRPAHPDAARVSPKFDLLAGACFPPRRTSQPADRDGHKNPRFHTLSDPVLWGHLSLGFKAIPAGWNIKETQVKAAILAAIVVIIAVGTMLVGPLPMVLLVVALVAFIDYVRSSETLAETAGDRAPDWRLLPSLIDSIALSRRGLAMGSAYYHRVRPLVFPAVQRVLAWGAARLSGVPKLSGVPRASGVARLSGIARLSGYVQSLSTRATRALNRNSESGGRGDDPTPTTQALREEAQPPPPPPAPPPLTLAEGHGLDAVRAALEPPKQERRVPTRDEARRLLDHLEGRI